MISLIRIFAFLSLCCIHSLAVYAQDDQTLPWNDETLLSIANGELEEFAKRAGYRLLKDRSRLSTPYTSVIVAMSAGATLGFVLTGPVEPFLGFVIGPFLALLAVDDASRALLNHYRRLFHYNLVNETGMRRRIEGSCLYFFAWDDILQTLYIEIDNCSHDDIFPQKEAGFIRAGDWADPFERYISDQDEVVVLRTISF